MSKGNKAPKKKKGSGPSKRGARRQPPQTVDVTVLGLLVPVALAERVRDACWHDREPIARFGAAALELELERREKARGKPYAPRESKIPRRYPSRSKDSRR